MEPTRRHVTLVISPLKSIISNQLYTWRKVGVKCAQLGSDKGGGEEEQQGDNNGNRCIHK